MFAFKGSFGFELIILIDSLTAIPFSCSEKNLRQFDINNVCALNNWFIRLEFDTSIVWQRLALNLIEFIQSLMVIRFSCCEKFEFLKHLDNNDISRAFAECNGFCF